MSYILEALKRSEQERHQGELNTATIDTIMLPPKPVRKHLWPYLLILVLFINVSVYLYFQFSTNVAQSDDSVSLQTKLSSTEIEAESVSSLQRGPQPQVNRENFLRLNDPQLQHANTNTNSSKSGNEHSSNEKPLPEHLLQTPNLAKRYDYKSVTQPTMSDSSNKSPQYEVNAEGFDVIRPKAKAAMPVQNDVSFEEPPLMATQNDETEQIVIDEPEVTVSKPNNEQFKEDISPKAEGFEDVSHLNDMNSTFQKGIPNIVFSSHIYSTNPADRRVMINDLYLREGQSFSGMKIATIGEFYIVLSKDARKFKLPVLRDWYTPR